MVVGCNPYQFLGIIISNIHFVEWTRLRVCINVIFVSGGSKVFSRETAETGDNAASPMLLRGQYTSSLVFEHLDFELWGKGTHPALIAVDKDWVVGTTKNDGKSRIEDRSGRRGFSVFVWQDWDLNVLDLVVFHPLGMGWQWSLWYKRPARMISRGFWARIFGRNIYSQDCPKFQCLQKRVVLFLRKTATEDAARYDSPIIWWGSHRLHTWNRPGDSMATARSGAGYHMFSLTPHCFLRQSPSNLWETRSSSGKRSSRNLLPEHSRTKILFVWWTLPHLTFASHSGHRLLYKAFLRRNLRPWSKIYPE